MTQTYDEVTTPQVHGDVDAPANAVWGVLADGWSYSGWVVGTARIRAVAPDWPRPGSRIHHSFGSWPWLIDDHTEVVRCDEGRMLELRARGWPMGEAMVRIEIEPHTDRCGVSLTEDAVSGPGTMVPSVVRQPMIIARNHECLRRLTLLAERRGHVSGE